MAVVYIRKSVNDEELIFNSNTPKLIKKIWIKIRKKLNIIVRRQIDNNILYIIPEIKNKNLQKVIQRRLKKEEKNVKIVLSEEIKSMLYARGNSKSSNYNCGNSNSYSNSYSNNFNNNFINNLIIDGKEIQKYAIKQILEYIINQSTQENMVKLEFQDIYLLQNGYNYDKIDMIQYLLNKVKTINVVTSSIDKYKKLEEKLYNEGYLITVSNNKKKSLKKAKIILNVDFTKEELSNYVINRDSIIINFTNEKIDNLKAFEGIIINKIEIDMKDEIKQYFKDNNIYEGFSTIELYQSICENGKFEEQAKKIEKNGIKVTKLIGNNGKISEKEPIFKKIFLTNAKN